MLATVTHEVRGIDGDCGGHGACVTCHVFIDESWAEKIMRPDARDVSMLHFAAGRQTNSRLACQITLTEDLGGIQVRMPVGQHWSAALARDAPGTPP